MEKRAASHGFLVTVRLLSNYVIGCWLLLQIYAKYKNEQTDKYDSL